MAKRRSISARTRFEVFKRDNFTCQYCGTTSSESSLHIDHITPVALGGGNEIHNLATACAACNLGKGAISLSCIPKSLEEYAKSLGGTAIAKYQDAIDAHESKAIDQLTKVIGLIFPDGWESLSPQEVRPIEAAIANIGADLTSAIAKDAGMPWVRDKMAYFKAAVRNKYKAIGI